MLVGPGLTLIVETRAVFAFDRSPEITAVLRTLLENSRLELLAVFMLQPGESAAAGHATGTTGFDALGRHTYCCRFRVRRGAFRRLAAGGENKNGADKNDFGFHTETSLQAVRRENRQGKQGCADADT